MQRRGIKNLKPNLKSKFKQGYFDTENPRKYVGQRPIIYRSSWEYMFMKYCENSDEILQWGSEVTSIPYYDFQGGRHTYYLDFTLKMRNGETILVEVKPSSQVPKTMLEVKMDPTKARNAAKWNAVREYIKTQPNTKFLIVTEKFFQKK